LLIKASNLSKLSTEGSASAIDDIIPSHKPEKIPQKASVLSSCHQLAPTILYAPNSRAANYRILQYFASF
jgi:hypothetical protein